MTKLRRVSTKGERPRKLATKLSMYIFLSVLLVFTILIGFIGVTTTKDLQEREQEKLALLASQNSTVARDFMENIMRKQEVIISAVKSIGGLDMDKQTEILKSIISMTLAEEQNILSLFLVAEPNIISPDTPNGYSIVASKSGTVAEAEMFRSVNKDVYDTTKANKSMSVADPFLKTIDGKEYTVITVLLPILGRDGEVTGMVGSNIDTSLLNSASYNNGGYNTFYNQIVCGHRSVIVHSQHPERIGKPFMEVTDSVNGQTIMDSAENPEPYALLDTNKDGKQFYKAFVPFYLKGSPVMWLSESSISSEEFNATIVSQLALILGVMVLSLSILTIAIFIRIKKSLRPINALDDAAVELAKGNLHVQIDYSSNDELGNLADSLRNSIAILSDYVSDIDRAMGEMADGNFDLKPGQPFIGDFENIEKSITAFIIKISSTLKQIGSSADLVSAGSEQVSGGAQELSQSATEQAASVEELSASLEDVSRQIRRTAENAAEGNRLANVVGNKIDTSNRQMSEMIAAITDISKSSEQIGKIIKTIEDIAFQTNILALNAAVEAARAGAAGKGFAVVADEVRNLATKSSEAAKQTNALIEGSVKSVENGVRIAGETAKSLADVVDGAKQMTGLIGEISNASDKQSSAIGEINQGIEQISSLVQTTSATSQESAASSEELSSQATILKELLRRFKIKH